MLYAKGSRVKLLHTGDEGTVTDIIDEQMVNVLLDDGDEIPAFIEDLIRIEDYRTAMRNKPPVKAKIVKGKTEKPKPEPDRPEVEVQYSILRSLGIQLAFVPQYRDDGSTEKYAITLINDTAYDVLYSFELYLANVLKIKSNGKLDSVTYIELGELIFDQLNDTPEVEFDCWQVTTEGTGKKISKTLKIKAQQFFKKIKTAPLLNVRVHHYVLFENFDAQDKKEEDLKSYAKRKSKPLKYKPPNKISFEKHSVSELAHFETEIDLHIDKLAPGGGKTSNAEKLRLQLYHFDAFIAKAVRVGAPRVFVIHGLGKGKLRNEIATRLMQNPDVVTFKNEFHPRYGWGATEVIFID